eukprot:2268092-Alexandrium_andersonii.AAC.1
MQLGAGAPDLHPSWARGWKSPRPNKGGPLHHSCTRTLRPRSRPTAQSSCGARVRITFREVIAFLMRRRP